MKQEEKKPLLIEAFEMMEMRAEEKSRQYGPFVESIERAAKIANEMCDVEITPETMCKCLIALKLGRLKYNYKHDTFLDALCYVDGLEKVVNSKE